MILNLFISEYGFIKQYFKVMLAYLLELSGLQQEQYCRVLLGDMVSFIFQSRKGVQNQVIELFRQVLAFLVDRLLFPFEFLW